MHCHLIGFEPIRRGGLVGKVDVTRITFDAHEVHIESSASGGNTAIVHPASPAAAEFDDGELVSCQVDRPQYRPPFRHIGMPVCGDRNVLHLPSPAVEESWEKNRVDQDAKEIG